MTSDHGELCGARALGCGPCQLIKGHKPERRHLCDHYAKGGVEFHDPDDSFCRCPDCERDRLAKTMDAAYASLVAANQRYILAAADHRAHMVRFGRGGERE